jgi:hypothetical protein
MICYLQANAHIRYCTCLICMAILNGRCMTSQLFWEMTYKIHFQLPFIFGLDLASVLTGEFIHVVW